MRPESPLRALALVPLFALACVTGTGEELMPDEERPTTRDGGSPWSLDAEPTLPTVDAGFTESSPSPSAPKDGGPIESGSTPPPAPHVLQTVFLIVMSSQDWSSIVGSPDAPYINKKLLPDAAVAENVQTDVRGEANYIWLEAGSDLGIVDDGLPSANGRDTPDHLVAYLEKSGISWTSWQEDISGTTCPLTTEKKYVPHHDPMVFFHDVTEKGSSSSANCMKHVRPYSELAAKLTSGSVPAYNFVTPNLCNDMHSCDVGSGDAWLSREIPKIQASKAYTKGGVILISWDEPKSGKKMGLIALSPFAKKGTVSSTRFSHASTLRTIQEIFGLTPLLRNAAKATSLAELFASYP